VAGRQDTMFASLCNIPKRDRNILVREISSAIADLELQVSVLREQGHVGPTDRIEGVVARLSKLRWAMDLEKKS